MPSSTMSSSYTYRPEFDIEALAPITAAWKPRKNFHADGLPNWTSSVGPYTYYKTQRAFLFVITLTFVPATLTFVDAYQLDGNPELAQSNRTALEWFYVLCFIVHGVAMLSYYFLFTRTSRMSNQVSMVLLGYWILVLMVVNYHRYTESEAPVDIFEAVANMNGTMTEMVQDAPARENTV